MTNPTIAAPAGFAPQMTVSFASSGDAQSVDSDHPLPIGERAFMILPLAAVTVVPGSTTATASCANLA